MIKLENADYKLVGSTYSISDYKEFYDGNKNKFEEVLDKMMLSKCIKIHGLDDSFKDRVKSLDINRRRLSILSLMANNADEKILFKNIRYLIDRDSVSKMEHIKDVLSMLRSYVPVGEIEKEERGEVMTSVSLVNKMLLQLPEKVWSNPNLKWFDSCNGTGPFLSVVIYKLMKGLSNWESDDEKRYKHIVENMIYCGELNPENMFLYMCAIDPHDEYNLNIYCGDFLQEGFNFHMKNAWGLNKFDIIVGNPPYNSNGEKNFYIKFFKKSFNLLKSNGLLSYITPSRFTIQPEFKDFRNIVESISKSVKLTNEGRIFGDKASFSVVITLIEIGNGCVVDWLDGFDDPIVRKLLGIDCIRLNTRRSKALLKSISERDSYSDIIDDKNTFLYFVNSKGKGVAKTPFRYLPYKEPGTFVPKVVMTEFVGTGMKKTLGKIYVDYNGDWGLGTDTSMYIEEKDPIKLNNLKDYLSTKVIDYVLNKICQSSHANQTMRLFPDLTTKLSKINDIEISNLLNLTDDEKKLLE